MISSIFFIIFAVLAAGILVVHAVVIAGGMIAAYREFRARRALLIGAAPSVSLVVPARNEEVLLPRLLASLRRMDTSDIPDFELVLVNDRSTDRTRQIMDDFARNAPWPVNIVEVPDINGDIAHTNPKQNALHHGTVGRTSDVLLFTDADCVVGKDWAREMVLPFREAGLGLLFGTVMPNSPEIFLYQYQGFDHVFRYYYTAGSAGIGNPTGGFGNNIAVRRQALETVGGFAGLRYSVTEDAELIAEVRDLHRYEVRPTLGPRTIVSPEPQHSLADTLSQSVRWNTGGLFAPDLAARTGYRTVMLFLLGSVVAVPFSLLFPPVLLATAGSFLSMLAVAVLAGAVSGRGPRYWLMLLPNVLFSMGFYSYVTLLTLAHTPVKWKGRILQTLRSPRRVSQEKTEPQHQTAPHGVPADLAAQGAPHSAPHSAAHRGARGTAHHNEAS